MKDKIKKFIKDNQEEVAATIGGIAIGCVVFIVGRNIHREVYIKREQVNRDLALWALNGAPLITEVDGVKHITQYVRLKK